MDDYVVHANNIDYNDSNNMYEVINVNHDLSYDFSIALTLTPRDKQSDSLLKHSHCLALAVAPYVMLEVSYLASCTPSLYDVEQYLEVDDLLD